MPTSFETSLGGDAPDTTATGFVLAVGGWAHGSIGVAGDADFIAIDLVAGQSYSFAMVGIGSNALTNPYLRLMGRMEPRCSVKMTTASPMATPSFGSRRWTAVVTILRPARSGQSRATMRWPRQLAPRRSSTPR